MNSFVCEAGRRPAVRLAFHWVSGEEERDSRWPMKSPTFSTFLHSARSARRPHARSDSVTATETTTRISFGVTMVDSSEVKLRRISHAAGLVAGFVLRSAAWAGRNETMVT